MSRIFAYSIKAIKSHKRLKRQFSSKINSNFGKCNIVEIGQVSPERPVPDAILKPQYFYTYLPSAATRNEPEVKGIDQIQHMRESGILAASILSACAHMVKEGNTTDAIDAFIHEKTISANAYPSPLRYAGFPKSVCTSVNNVACHGIPDSRRLVDGDIVNVDVTVYYQGYHGDCSQTFLVGDVDDRGRYLVDCTRECLELCIKICGPNVPFNTIGCFITEYCKRKSLAVIPAFIGHGIGTYFHGPPEVLHYDNNLPGTMVPGITFTIEPILTLGGPDIAVLDDGWTAVTADGARSAQFEHTILITDSGAEILTTDSPSLTT